MLKFDAHPLPILLTFRSFQLGAEIENTYTNKQTNEVILLQQEKNDHLK